MVRFLYTNGCNHYLAQGMNRFRLIFSFLLCLSAPEAYAQPSGEALIEGTKLCTRYLPRYERQHEIPTHLLSAIASTESGRYHEGLGLRLPWPWTINAEGKGYYYDSKAQAVAAAQKFRQQGIRSMDVGCMQVNLHHHAGAFASLDEAFDPQKNVAYAASFLRRLYEEDRSWKNAAAAYHSKTPVLGRNYAGRVYDSWYRIIDKLKAARLQVPETSVAALKDLGTLKTAALPQPQPAAVSRPKSVASYKPPVMNSIKVTSVRDSQRENGVIIVKPTIRMVDEPVPVSASVAAPEILTRSPLTLADAASHEPRGEARIIRLGDDRLVKSSTVRGGPNFVFSD